jgi:arylsulfatase A-like enzyme
VGAAIAPPEVILVLTIDAFRCGFGRSDRPELRDICPALTARLPAARANLRTHVFYPATIPNMRVLLGVYPRDSLTEAGSMLEEVKDAGYRVEIAATHPHFHQQPAIQHAADAIDETLVARALMPTGITSPALTDRLLARLGRHDGSPLLLWAHYFDPHAPYVLEEGEHWRHDEISSYAAEVRRTDAAIERLLDALDGGARDVLVLITADHGEEFGEHGARNHGHSLRRAASEVPFLALRLGPKHGQLPAEVPFSSHDVGRYMAAAALGRPFQPSTFALGHLEDNDDRQFFFVQGDWKLVYRLTDNIRELYQLTQDPDEQLNRAEDAADTAENLGRTAAALYQNCVSH